MSRWSVIVCLHICLSFWDGSFIIISVEYSNENMSDAFLSFLLRGRSQCSCHPVNISVTKEEQQFMGVKGLAQYCCCVSSKAGI